MQGGMPQGGFNQNAGTMGMGGAFGMVGNLAAKAGVEHLSAADLLTPPTAQILRLPDGQKVTIPFPPSPPEAPLEIDAGEIRAAAIIDHSEDILAVLGKLSGNRSAAKTLQSFAKSEHLDKNFLKEWQQDPEKFDQFLQDHANDPGLAKLITLIQKDHEGGQIFKEIADDIDASLQAYNDEVTQYEADYAQYQQAFTDHLSLMKSEILPQLSASGLISGDQLDHLLSNLADQGGAIDFSQVAPQALFVDDGSGDDSTVASPDQGDAGQAGDEDGSSDGSSDGANFTTTDQGDSSEGDPVDVVDDGSANDSWGGGDAGSDSVDSGDSDSSSSDFLANFMASLADDAATDESGGSSDESWDDPSTDSTTDSSNN